MSAEQTAAKLAELEGTRWGDFNEVQRTARVAIMAMLLAWLSSQSKETPMTDTPTPGEKLDELIAEVKVKTDDLRAALGDFGSEARDRLAELIDDLSAKVDEVRTAWEERRNT
jgi:hypothetical protein